MEQTLTQRLRAMPDLIDSPQVVKLLQISPATLRNMTTKNYIPYLRIGRSIRFDPAQLALWIEQKVQRGAGTEAA